MVVPLSVYKLSLLEDLLFVYDSGIPLKIKGMHKADYGDLANTIVRPGKKSPYPVLFENFTDARNQLFDYVSNNLNDKKKAKEMKASIALPRTTKYSKKIVNAEMFKLFNSTGDLSYGSLKKTIILTAIRHRDVYGNCSSYKTIGSAREAFAKLLEKRGCIEDAKKVRFFNTSNGLEFSEIKKEQIRNELIEILRTKISSGEDVSFGYQNISDRNFAYRGNTYFLNYGDMFSKANLDYSSYAKQSPNNDSKKFLTRIVDRELKKITEVSSVHSYFKTIILPKVITCFENEESSSIEQIRENIYSFGGIRLIESYVHKLIMRSSKVIKDKAIQEMKQLRKEVYRGEDVNVYKELQRITSLVK